MLKGFNTDLLVRGQPYHVQTEDWGNQNPFLVSRIFRNGAVVKTFKVSYTEAMKTGPVHSETDALLKAMRSQHQRILDQLTAGQIS